MSQGSGCAQFLPSTGPTEGTPRSPRQKMASSSSRMPLAGACILLSALPQVRSPQAVRRAPRGCTAGLPTHVLAQKGVSNETLPRHTPCWGTACSCHWWVSSPLRLLCIFLEELQQNLFIFFFPESDFVRRCNFHVSRGKTPFGREMGCCEDPGADCLTHFAFCLSPFHSYL